MKSILAAAVVAVMGLAPAPAAAQLIGPITIGDKNNCQHAADPGLAARIGTLQLSERNTKAMLGVSSMTHPSARCADYVDRNMCSSEWAKAATSGLGVTDFFTTALFTMAQLISGEASPEVVDGATSGAVLGGVLGGLLGAARGKSTLGGAVKWGLAGGALGSVIGAVTAPAVDSGTALSACRQLETRGKAEIDAMIRAGKLRPVRTEAELDTQLANWAKTLKDAERIATIDALRVYSAGIADRINANIAK